jgi:tetratricopeptide (TPR) repeat protein
MSQKENNNAIVINQTSHGNGDNIAGDKIINSPEHKVPVQLTSTLGNDNLIGRKKELQEIETLLNSSKTLLIKGIGGVGKSSISSYYLHLHKEDYSYYGFFEDLDRFLSELEEPLDLKSEKDEDSFLESLSKLRKLEGDKLLVFDDVKDTEENEDKIKKILALKDSGYKIIFTSREDIEGMAQYPLDVLSVRDAKELFTSIYEVEDELLLEEVLGYLDYHAFFIEKTAHSIKKTLTLEMIREKFEKNEFPQISVKRKENFDKLLNQLFNLDGLDTEEILNLKQLSILPSIEITFEFLQEIFNKKNDEKFEEILNYFCEKGWLGCTKNGYKLHQIIKEYILDNHAPTFEEIESEVDFFSKVMEDSSNMYVYIKSKYNLIYFKSLIKIFDKIKIENEKIGRFFILLGNIYMGNRNYKQADYSYTKSMRISENIFGKNHNNTADSYYALGTLYTSTGEYTEAEIFYKKSLDISTNILGKNHPDVANIYNSLGEFYRLTGEYKKAEPFYVKSIMINKEQLGEEHPTVAISLGNLAIVCELLGEYEKADLFYRKSIDINERVLGLNNSITATSYNNLGEFYKLVGAYELAVACHKLAMDIRERVLGEEHPLTIDSYNNLAEIYELIGNYKESELLYIKAIALCEKVFGVNHMDTAGSYNNLAFLYDAQGKNEEAYTSMKKAIEINEKILEEGHLNLITSRTSLKMMKEKL